MAFTPSFTSTSTGNIATTFNDTSGGGFGGVVSGVTGFLGDNPGVVNGIAGAASDLFSAAGSEQAASNYGKAAAFAGTNEALAQESTRVQQLQEQRQTAQVIGQQEAEVGGAGLAESGTALSLMRSSHEQGALTSALTGVQGTANAVSYAAQQQAYLGQQQAEESAATGKDASGAFSLIGAALPLLALL